MARPNIYSYDRTAHGAGSKKDGDRLSGEDIRNLEKMVPILTSMRNLE